MGNLLACIPWLLLDRRFRWGYLQITEDKDKNSIMFGSRFYAPGWWVQAYEGFFDSDNKGLGPFQISLSSRMTPALNSIELSAICVVFSRLQKSILSKKVFCKIDSDKHRKYRPLGGKARSFAFERALQVLGSIKILSPSQGGKLDSVALISSETWNVIGDAISVSLEVSPLGRELFLGFGEPYVDAILRELGGKPSVMNLSLGLRPLALSQSAWLDLQGLEQLIFLRIMRAVQFDAQIVRLDGTHGTNIGSLFGDVAVGSLRKDMQSEFLNRLSLLTRIGRKLVDHGVLEKTFLEGYTAASDVGVSTNTTVLWKDSSILEGADFLLFRAAVSKYLLKSVYWCHISSLLKVIAGKLFDQRLLQQIRVIWEHLEKNYFEEMSYCFASEGCRLFLAGPLYIEWVVRLLPGHEMPLPKSLLESALARFCGSDSGQDRVASFKAFADLLKNRTDLVELLKSTEGACFSMLLTYQSKSYGDFLAHSSFFDKVESRPLESRVIEKVDAEPKSVKKVRIESRKETFSELQKIRLKKPEKYAHIKASFLESLDSQSRKIFREIESRLTPKAFEDQIKHKLVKYLMENPGAFDS